MSNWRKFTKSIKRQVNYYKALAIDSRTPKFSKILIGIAISYLLSPIDIIPDFIPILGYLDDLIIVPSLIAIAMLFIPKNVKIEVRESINTKEQ